MNDLDILIVEDELFQREMLRDFLVKEGHRTAEADNGEMALNLIAGHSFDLVLLDYRIPGMDGIEVLTEAKKGQSGARGGDDHRAWHHRDSCRCHAGRCKGLHHQTHRPR